MNKLVAWSAAIGWDGVLILHYWLHFNCPYDDVALHLNFCIQIIASEAWSLSFNVDGAQESTSEPDRAQCSRRTADLIREVGPVGLKLLRRGEIQIKGKGVMETFWITPESYSEKGESA